jgi:hypothetical protein
MRIGSWRPHLALTALLLLAVLAPVSAAPTVATVQTLSVDGSAPTASDITCAPCKTIQGALNLAGPGASINRMASKVGRFKRLTFSAVTVGRLRGISGTATYARKPYRLVVVALPDRSGRHVFVLAAIVHSRATARDVQQYKAVVASLRPMSRRRPPRR